MSPRNKAVMIILLGLFLLSSCIKPEVRMTRDQLNIIDSLFLAERKIWVDQLEDSCALMRNTYFDIWVDSMKSNRLRDIEKMLGK